jgi:hypothetical protein
MSTIGLRNKLRQLGYDARVVNWDCIDIDQGGRMHYLSTDEAEALAAAGSGIDLGVTWRETRTKPLVHVPANRTI